MAWEDIPQELRKPLYDLATTPEAYPPMSKERHDAIEAIGEYLLTEHGCAAETAGAVGPRFDHGGLPAEYCDNIAMVDSYYCEEHQEKDSDDV